MMKKSSKSSAFLLTLGFVLIAVFTAHVFAQSFPTKSIKIIVGYPAGGSIDATARQLALVLNEKTGQPVVVENKPGGASVIAVQALLSARPDGYTVGLFDPATVSMNQHLFKKLVYDPSSLIPVTTIVKIRAALVVPNNSSFRTLKDYVDAAKAKPGNLTFGSTGSGNFLHLAMEQFKSQAGIEVTHVPYKGAAVALQDLMGGQIQSLIVDLPSATPFIKAGQVRALAVTSSVRSEALPNAPTFAESGYANFTTSGWTGIFVPTGTPGPVITQLNTLFRDTAASPQVMSWIKSVTLEQSTSTPGEFANLIKSDADGYGTIIKRLGFSLD